MFLTQRTRKIAALLAAFSWLATVAYADSDSDSDSDKRYRPARAELRMERASRNVAVPVGASAAEPARIFVGSVSCDTQSRATRSRVWQKTSLALDRAVSPSARKVSGGPETFSAVQLGGLAGSLVSDSLSQMTISIRQRSSVPSRLRETLDFEVSADPESGWYDESGRWTVGVDGQGNVTLQGSSFARLRAGANGWHASCRWDLTADEPAGPFSLEMIERLFTPPTAAPSLLGSSDGGCGGLWSAGSDAGWVAAGFLGFVPGAAEVLSVFAVGTSIAGSSKGSSCLTTTLDNMNQQLQTQEYQIQQIENYLYLETNLLYKAWYIDQSNRAKDEAKNWEEELKKISPSEDANSALQDFMTPAYGLGMWDFPIYDPNGVVFENGPNYHTDPEALAKSLSATDRDRINSRVPPDFFGAVNSFSGSKPITNSSGETVRAILDDTSTLIIAYESLWDAFVSKINDYNFNNDNVVPLYDQYNTLLVHFYQKAVVGLQQAFTIDWMVNQINYFAPSDNNLFCYDCTGGSYYTYQNRPATEEKQAYHLAQKTLANHYVHRLNRLYLNTVNYIVSDVPVAPTQAYPITPFTFTYDGHGLAYVQQLREKVSGSWSADVVLDPNNPISGTWESKTFTTSGGAEGIILSFDGSVLTFFITGNTEPADNETITIETGDTGTLASPTAQVAWDALAKVGDKITFDGSRYYQIDSIPQPWELTLTERFAESNALGTKYAVTLTHTKVKPMDYTNEMGKALKPLIASTNPKPDQGATPLSLVPPVADGSWQSNAALYQFSGLHDVAACISSLSEYNASTVFDPNAVITPKDWLETTPGACPPIFTTPVLYAAGVDNECNTSDDNVALYGPDGACGTLDDLAMPFYDGNTLAPYTSFQAASNSTGGPMVLTGMMKNNLKFCDPDSPALGWYAPTASFVNNEAGLMGNTAYLNCGNWYVPKYRGATIDPNKCGFPRATCPPDAQEIYGTLENAFTDNQAEVAAKNTTEGCTDNLQWNGNKYPWIMTLTDSLPSDMRNCDVIANISALDGTILSPLNGDYSRFETGSFASSSAAGCSLGFIGSGLGNDLPGIYQGNSNKTPQAVFGMRLPNFTDSGGLGNWSGWVLPLAIQAYCNNGGPQVDAFSGINLSPPVDNPMDYAGYTCTYDATTAPAMVCTIPDGTQYRITGEQYQARRLTFEVLQP